MTMTTVDLRAEAAAEVRRLERARAVVRDGDEHALARLEGDTTWIAMPRRGRLRRALGRRVCLVWRVAFEGASGGAAESRLVPVLVEISHRVGRVLLDPAPTRLEWIRSLLEQTDGLVRARVEAECDEWAVEVARVADAFTTARLARGRMIDRPQSRFSILSQPGLFDRRAERSVQARAAETAESEQAALERLRTIAAAGAIARLPARLLLVLVP